MKSLAALFLLMVSLAWTQRAAAADCPTGASCDQGKAYSMCKAAVARTVERFTATNAPGVAPKVNEDCVSYTERYSCSVSQDPSGGQVRCWNSDGTSSSGFYFKGACSARPEQTGWKGSGAAGIGSVCSEGCAYDGSLDASSPTGRSFIPNGNVCASSDLPPPENATPGDGGGDGGGGGGETGGGNEGGGNEGGGGGGGGGGNGGGGGGGGGGEGEGEGGGEGGGGGGVTPGPGEGEGDGDGDGPGQTTPPDGKLYKKSQKTMEKVVDDFFEKAQKTQMVKGITDFMKVPGGGSCPTFTVAASKWWRTMTYSAHCSGDFLALLRLCGYVIFAIAAYAAVRIALT